MVHYVYVCATFVRRIFYQSSAALPAMQTEKKYHVWSLTFLLRLPRPPFFLPPCPLKQFLMTGVADVQEGGG